MSDRFEAMSVLLEVVDRGSLSGAGRSLGLPVSTISRRLSDLEERLGTRLLVRTTRKLQLTDAGVQYVEAARQIVERVEDAEREAAGEFLAPRGELIVTAPVYFGRLFVLPVIGDFLKAYPEIRVRLVLSDRNVHLVDDHVDLAVRIGSLPDSAMIATSVGSMRSVACGSPALLARCDMPSTPAELVAHPCVAMDSVENPVAWTFRDPQSGRNIEVRITPRLTVSTAEAAADAAIRDIGITRLFLYQVASAVKSGALRVILEEFEPVPAPINLIHATRKRLPVKMRHFLDFATPRLRRAIAALQ